MNSLPVNAGVSGSGMHTLCVWHLTYGIAAAMDGFVENMVTQVWLFGVEYMWQVFLSRELDPEIGKNNNSENWKEVIHPVLMVGKGRRGIENKVLLSLLCILKAQGLPRVINQKLKADEIAQLKKSADTLGDIQKE
ncbi:L-lactate dehydrogenase B chain [Camelus dromedarius]|uniref:L-lactate dehydrogenase B chain n=1 Tax=Camelus dromedarius TaxID=9838 RepID=A0A5N4DSD3_CAMDR|nr:L-lactate dehydrogenase B chain [Camelus dromedarius]